jgi:plasmid maintenance system antidote protein VapI
MSDSERLNDLISFLNLKPVEFARSLGYDRATIIYNILNGKNGISRNIANQIVSVYTQVNYEWILRGEGLMLKWQKAESDLSPLHKVCDNQIHYETKCLACIAKDKEILDLKEIIQNQVKEWGTVCRDYRERSRRRDTG